MPDSSPKILAILPGFMPTTLMYIIKPFLGLETQGRLRARISLEAYFDVDALHWADLVVFCRNVEPRYSYILDAVLARRIPYIYDIDDNLFEVPAQVVDGEYYRAPERLALLQRYLQGAARVRVYSERLFAQVHTLNKQVCQMAPVIDWHVVNTPVERKTGDRIKIVYATSRRDDYLFPIFTPALKRVMQAHPKRIESHFWGFQPADFRGASGVSYRKFDPNYDAYMRRLSSAGFAIGLAPMLDDDFHRAKTNTKFREYGACGIAGIYSDTPLYSEWVEHRKTGLLVENTTAAWTDALELLIDNPELCRSIGQAARARVQQEYSQERFEQAWQAMILDVLAESPTTPLGPSAASVLLKPAGGGTETAVSTAGATQVSGNPMPAAAPTPARIWRTKLGRALELLHSGQIGKSIYNARVHVNNLLWLFKINRLKRL